MKHLITLVLVMFSVSLFAAESIITDIDDFETVPNYVEVSEEGLPQDHYNLLIQQIGAFGFTMLSDAYVNSFFASMTKNSQARNKLPGGRCSYRRAYIQNKLKSVRITSGKMLVHCPTNTGRLRLRDRSTGRYYTYANFHDVNIVAVNTNSGPQFRILDVQFEDTPVSLHTYLTEIEASQRIKPLKRKGTGSSKGLCYWSITTPYLRVKEAF